jgi:phenylpyruvate tautomerase PptA (4-oxalocrotonate tautomerase family)
VIIAVTALNDISTQNNMSKIGVEIYIHKPVDRELVRYKLESIGSSLRSRSGNMEAPSTKDALNPFNSDIRSFKTFFEITNTEGMMDFGMWLFDQYNGKSKVNANKFDIVLEVFYKLMNQAHKDKKSTSIIIEESYEEFYITIKFDNSIVIEQKTLEMLSDLGTESLIKENVVCVRLSKPNEFNTDLSDVADVQKPAVSETKESPKENIPAAQENLNEVDAVLSKKETREIDSKERELLHQSFVNKTSASDYIGDIGGDVLDEILDLASIEEEWIAQLHIIEDSSSESALVDFSNNVLGAYIRAINNLFEFTALGYALSSLSAFIRDSANVICEDSAKLKLLVMLLEHLGTDLTAWREHIFVLQDTDDIHYLDSSFFSSCMQIEGIIADKNLGSDDDNDMEFF